jgi:hypothetical protein
MPFATAAPTELGAKLIVRTVEEAICQGHRRIRRPARSAATGSQIPVLLAADRGISVRLLPSAAHGATRKRRARRNDFFSFRDSASANGIQKTSDRRSGTSTTPA